MYTFSLTIACRDDHGSIYDPASHLAYLTDLLTRDTKAELFTVAQGYGSDTEFDGTPEPIIIVQGSAPSLFTLDTVRTIADHVADRMSQRAVGWFVSTDSYSKVV